MCRESVRVRTRDIVLCFVVPVRSYRTLIPSCRLLSSQTDQPREVIFREHLHGAPLRVALQPEECWTSARRTWLAAGRRLGRAHLALAEGDSSDPRAADDDAEEDEEDDDHSLDVEQVSRHHFDYRNECGLVMARRDASDFPVLSVFGWGSRLGGRRLKRV